jgi:hypothetical protein
MKFLVLIISLIIYYIKSQDVTWQKKKNIDFPGLMRVVNEGVSHDSTHFYFSNQHLLYKTTIDPIEEIITKEGIPLDLLKLEYNHIGGF